MKDIIQKIFKLVNKEKERLLFLGTALLIIFAFIVFSHDKFDDLGTQKDATDSILLDSASIMEQEIMKFQHEYVSAINIMFGTYARKNDGTVTVSFKAGSETLASWMLNSSVLADGAYREFKLASPAKINPDTSYKITIEEEYEGENGVAVWRNSEDEGVFYINGNQEQKGCVCYTLTYRNINLKRIVRAIGIIFAFLVLILIWVHVNEVFLMAYVLGILLCFYMWLCPLGMAPDEGDHFLRGYEVANVSLISKRIGESGNVGNYLPSTIRSYKDENAIIGEDITEFYYANTALYSPISYLPQAIGIKIGGLFTKKVSGLFRVGRYVHAVMNFILCVSALAIIPFGRKILFMIMTFPIVLQEMISMSPDGFTIALSLLFLAYIFKVSYETKPINYCDIVILSSLGVALSLCKIIYIVLLLLVFMIPNERFKTKWQWGGLLLRRD